MTRSIATTSGQPTQHIALTQEEIDSLGQATDAELLQIERDKKKEYIKECRDVYFAKLLFYKTIDSVSYYLKPKPSENIFLAGLSMGDADVKPWYPYSVDGVKFDASLDLTKADLISLANHYEARKTTVYNLCNQMCFDVDALTTIAAIDSYDTSIIEL